MYAERDKYVTKLKHIESDLITLKNNIGLLRKFKNAEALIKDVERKIEMPTPARFAFTAVPIVRDAAGLTPLLRAQLAVDARLRAGRVTTPDRIPDHVLQPRRRAGASSEGKKPAFDVVHDTAFFPDSAEPGRPRAHRRRVAGQRPRRRSRPRDGPVADRLGADARLARAPPAAGPSPSQQRLLEAAAAGRRAALAARHDVRLITAAVTPGGSCRRIGVQVAPSGERSIANVNTPPSHA